MDSGTYFELRESSDLLKGQILFSYTGIVSDKGLKYPVVLVFNKERIDFYFSGLIKTDTNESDYPEFIETLLFSLNLHKGKENVSKLNDSLRDLFVQKFPVVKDYVIYNGSNAKNSHEKHKTYAELKQLPPLDKKSEKGSFGEKLPYRVLLLDFLFDVYHSDVFDNCPGFILIKQHLDEIPFIQAIKRKAEFYYQVENNRSNPIATFDTCKSLYIDKLVAAETSWLEILQAEDAHKIINPNNKWFSDVETEVSQILKENVAYKIREYNKQGQSKDSHKFIQRPFRVSSFEWFIKRNNFIEAWKSTYNFYEGWRRKKKEGSFLFLLFSILLLLITLFELVNIILTIEGCNKLLFIRAIDLAPKFYSIIYILISLFLLIEFVYIILRSYKKLYASYLRDFLLFSYKLLMVSFLLLILTSAFLTFEVSSLGNKYLLIYSNLFKNGTLNIILLFLIIYFVFSVIDKIGNKKKSYKIIIGLILTIITIAISFYKLQINITQFLIPLFLSSLILVLLFFDERKNFPNLSPKTSYKKVLSMFIIGLIISFFSNLIVINFSYKDYLEKFNFVDEIWNNAINEFHNPFVTIDGDTLMFDTSSLSKASKDEITDMVNKTESSKISANKEESYYALLEKLKIYKKSKKDIGKESEFYPIVKTINIHGFKIITMPAVLFINTFLTLLLAVLIQIVLDHRRFLEGGKA